VINLNYKKWLDCNAKSLQGKTVAVTGATGGIGVELCRHLAYLGAKLILLNRSEEKTNKLINELTAEFSQIKADFIPLQLEDVNSVKSAVDKLRMNCPDILIHNAGAYSIPRYKTQLQLDNVFQINFLSPYYITVQLLEALSKAAGRVVVVGSIAHNYSKTDENNIDFADITAASKVYGNAKRRLMLAMYELFKNENNVSMCVVHPGITFTNITNHYPKLIFAVIKNPMKVIFMKPKKAALCIVKGIFEDCKYGEWIGPRVFDVWGLPRKRKLKTFTKSEAEEVYKNASVLVKKFD